MEGLRVGDVRTHPTCPGSAREADLVRGPAYDGMLSPVVPAPLLASPLSALLPPASKIHHFVMDSVCACLAMHGSAREAGLLRGPACDMLDMELSDTVGNTKIRHLAKPLLEMGPLPAVEDLRAGVVCMHTPHWPW